jgi:hypothetical protein
LKNAPGGVRGRLFARSPVPAIVMLDPRQQHSLHPGQLRSMTRPLAILCALVLAAPTAIATAHAEEDCGDLGRNYQLIEREAVSVQTNMALQSVLGQP